MSNHQPMSLSGLTFLSIIGDTKALAAFNSLPEWFQGRLGWGLDVVDAEAVALHAAQRGQVDVL